MRDISAWTASRISKPRSVYTSRKTNLWRRKIMVHKILILEDDQPILDLMDMMIRKTGYEPGPITNGLEALDLIKKGTTRPYPAGYHDGAYQRVGNF